MTSLNAIHGTNPWCVPAALSAITGYSTDYCAEIIQQVTGQKGNITAVHRDNYLEALRRLRHDAVEVNTSARSLYGVIAGLANFDGFYILRIKTGQVTTHAIVIEIKDKKVYLIDNSTKEPIPAQSSARLMQGVEQVFKITPWGEKKLIDTKVTVSRGINRVYVDVCEFYADERDNVTRSTSFIVKDDDELKLIVKGLANHIGITNFD